VNVEPESGTTQRDFSLPRLPPDTPSQDFDLVETSRTSSQENGFVKLRFNGTTFELAKLAAGQVPIDLYLDQEFIQAIATLPLKVPQLIHREVYGARLRMAIADFEGIDSTYEFSDEAIPGLSENTNGCSIPWSKIIRCLRLCCFGAVSSLNPVVDRSNRNSKLRTYL
jgi:hypothetical protein